MCERNSIYILYFGIFQNSILYIPYFVLSLMSLLSLLLLWLCHYCYCLKCYHWPLVKASRSQDSYKQTRRPTNKLLEQLKSALSLPSAVLCSYVCPTEAQTDIPELWVGEECCLKEILGHPCRVYQRFILDLAPTDQVTDSEIDSYFLPGNIRSRHGVKLARWNLHCQNSFRL